MALVNRTMPSSFAFPCSHVLPCDQSRTSGRPSAICCSMLKQKACSSQPAASPWDNCSRPSHWFRSKVPIWSLTFADSTYRVSPPLHRLCQGKATPFTSLASDDFLVDASGPPGTRAVLLIESSCLNTCYSSSCVWDFL